MGQQQSKDELLYEQVNYGNAEGIKALHRDGAGLEWMDREGKTALIVACMNSERFHVAKTLLELGANVNAYRPGRNGGTPLHHAAKRGLEKTAKLLLSHGANALVMNDDCQTPLEVARAKGYTNVVRALENHMCLFAGWMREFYGPGFLEVLEAFAPQLLSRKVWVVILPCGARNPTKPFKLELAVYSSQQDAQPRAVIALWKANLEDPKFHLSDPSVIIVDNSTIPRGRRRRRRSRSRTNRQSRFKFAPANERDSQQLQWFCDACKGIPQATQPAFLRQMQPQVPATAPLDAEDMELAMAINASIQSAMQERPLPYSGPVGNEGSSSATYSVSFDGSSSSHTGPAPSKETPSKQPGQETVSAVRISEMVGDASSLPSAPPALVEVADGPIQYPSIDNSPIDFSSSAVENYLPPSSNGGGKGGDEETCCAVCLDAPVEGACVPCGHMAGCMSCLETIKAKKSGCPVCRAKIDQVIRLYTV